MGFWTYMLHCGDGTFYVGHTDNLDVRIAQHLSGEMRGYTSTRHPLTLVWSDEFSSRYEALAAERQIKGWGRAKKMALIRGDWAEISRLARNSEGREGASTGSARTGQGVDKASQEARRNRFRSG
jgi:putative endonuclease